MASNIGEGIEFAGIVSVIIAGINIIWGFLIIPIYVIVGFLGIIFAIVDLILFFYAMKTKKIYEEREYEKARDTTKNLMFLGFVFGLIILGFIFYLSYKNLDEIITKKYLVKAPEKPFYPPPQFPQ